MPIKKSELYSSLWASCDELRGGMDASQYKDYVLALLFIKYISDRYANSEDCRPPIKIPKDASFQDMALLKGQSDIGDRINTKIIGPLVEANKARLSKHDFPNFNDTNKLGEGNAIVERLTNLIAIFEKPELDFSKNRAEHDDILGDAYEYLMRHFAQDSGKSKGQFYTPSEVSRIIARLIGIGNIKFDPNKSWTLYDPAAGSGSLLIRAADEAPVGPYGDLVTIHGQEKDISTAGLANMNLVLHHKDTGRVERGNTLVDPSAAAHLRIASAWRL